MLFYKRQIKTGAQRTRRSAETSLRRARLRRRHSSGRPLYKRRDAPRWNVPSENYVRSIEFLRRYSASVSFAAKRTLLISESSCIFDEYPPDILSSAAFTVGW